MFIVIKIFNIILWLCIFAISGAEGASNQLITSSSLLNRLDGRHLRVIWPNWEGNPKGLSGPTKGKLIIDYLAARFHFTYEFVRVTENWLEPINETVRGQMNYLLDDEVDLLLYQIVPRSGREKLIDLTCGFSYDTISLLIPVSAQDMSSNTGAIIKPFQWPVWLLLLLSIASVTYIFRQIQKLLIVKSIITDFHNQNNLHVTQIKLTNPYLYVFGNALSQGGNYTVNRLPIRLIAGVWSLAAFVFVQAYNSTLITYVLAPTNRPLVSSFHELAESSNVVFWIKKEGTIEKYLYSTEYSSDLLAGLRSRVSTLPESRCTFISGCMDRVKPGLNNVYADVTINLMKGIKERFLQTGKCELEIIGSDLNSLYATFGLQKNSPYTSTVSKGVNELRENGLFNYWDILLRVYPPQCTANIKGLAGKQGKHDHLRRLSLKNLTGAFIVLLTGIGFSLLFFLGELYSSK